MKKRLLDLLACPICLGPLVCDRETDPVTEGRLTCDSCGSVYSIQSGLPILLVRDRYWKETCTEVEGEQQFVHELPLSEHVKRNHFETGRTRRLLDRVEIPHRPLVLDVGGSSGLGAYLFREYGAEVVVTDIVPFFVQLAEVCLGDCMTVHAVPSGVEWLPFESDCFDVVFCRQALHHSLEPLEALREMFRVARPGGLVLVASEPCLTLFDVWKKRAKDKKALAKEGSSGGVLDKLPDEQFAHSWPDFRRWFSSLTEDFEIVPAGGTAGILVTDRGLVYSPYHREQRWKGKLLRRLLPGNRGFRGDIHIVARKTRPVQRENGRPVPEALPLDEWKVGPLSEETIREQREIFPKMFPFPVKI